ncbi:Allophanate hydrolase subunit 1 [Gluconacetobacter diazotrophicus PA1 5]|uniref:5-oxoprolinase subunit PxpB n=2 Tax=Gluconacetobacter diazotrophicus TaxID=33996 RepID=A0A7W4I720_GLUDI|nr:5-oxoprolinase subunit PxpB [Gluconacetobacter diazotrophicus]ACI52029.1 Allophanate hydrolase subunit 1 [Gluconacetobacter diazotrophicus PA1 5]MBB2157460.1 5-oxoprolinase subunit PxpB [Gluconacetobacter diazotrophicus]TWB05222.1 KipI family sensor histidine kinase inhibitor [Gluconacetobacter diazotrophicus]CAP54148.1 putative allophanate hydrolase subunit 1 [Gluconacetobacter diazotrophicus PA1 5]
MIRLSMAGTGAILLDAAAGPFDAATQRRIWAAARALAGQPSVVQAVPGVNNLLVTFDALRTEPDAVEDLIRRTWAAAAAEEIPAREIEIPVTYGGAFGEDLALVAAHAGLSEEETIAAHLAGRYSVAAIGAMAGFAYMTGLDSRLAVPRRDTPRLSVERGAVVVGGGHAGVMPCTAPSGWHIIGRTTLPLFDPHRPDPGVLRIGDTVRFTRVA